MNSKNCWYYWLFWIFRIIPTRRTATSSKQLCLEDMILYVLKNSDSMGYTRSFDFRYQNIITEKRVLRYQKQSICTTMYTGLVAFLLYDRFGKSAIVLVMWQYSWNNYILINAIAISLTFVPVGPVKISPPTFCKA